MDVIARLPDCDGPAADAVSVCTQVKLEDAPGLLKVPKSEYPDFWIRLSWHTNGRNHGQTLKILWFFSNEIYTDTHKQDCHGKKHFEDVLVGAWMGKSTKLGMSVCSIENKDHSYRKTWTTWKCMARKQSMAPMWNKSMKNVDFDEPSIFGMYSTWMQTEWNSRIHKDVWITYFCRSNWKVTRMWKSLTQQRWHGLMIWKDMLENALSDAAKWWEKDRAVIQSFKSLFGWLLILNRNKLNQQETSHKHAHKLS